jgi:26S proteasome regulatory subunit T3
LQEAGLRAVRSNRYVILNKDFEEAYKNNTKKTETDFAFYN